MTQILKHKHKQSNCEQIIPLFKIISSVILSLEDEIVVDALGTRAGASANGPDKGPRSSLPGNNEFDVNDVVFAFSAIMKRDFD